MLPKISEMAMAIAKVTLTVFGTLYGLHPLCRAFSVCLLKKEADAKIDSAFSDFGCSMLLFEALMHCS